MLIRRIKDAPIIERKKVSFSGDDKTKVYRLVDPLEWYSHVVVLPQACWSWRCFLRRRMQAFSNIGLALRNKPVRMPSRYLCRTVVKRTLSEEKVIRAC